jgi:hypothetical protein
MEDVGFTPRTSAESCIVEEFLSSFHPYLLPIANFCHLLMPTALEGAILAENSEVFRPSD